jgi:hypothetical protein
MTLESRGTTVAVDSEPYDSDTHKTMHVHSTITWKTVAKFKGGLMTDYSRTEVDHVNINNQFNDEHRIATTLQLVSHAAGR